MHTRIFNKGWCVGLCLAGVLSTLPALAESVSVFEATKAEKEAAQQTYKAASDLFDAERYTDAITAFQASYDIVRSPNSHLMIARCLKKVNRLDEAYVAYQEVIAEAEALAEKDDRYGDTANAAAAEFAQLKTEVALLTISLKGLEGETDVSIDDRTVKSSELVRPIALAPGSTSVSAVSASGERVEQTVELAAGEESSVELDLTGAPAAEAVAPPPEAAPATVQVSGSGTPTTRTLAYVAGGVGVAGMATFAAFGLMNSSKFSDLESACPNNRCTEDQQDNIDTGRMYQNIANIGLIAGAVGLGAGAVLFILSLDGEESAPEAQARATELVVSPGYVGLQGRF